MQQASIDRHSNNLIGRKEVAEKWFPCLICVNTFPSKIELFRHMFGHREKKLPCKPCNKLFTYVGLQEHLIKNHNSKTGNVNEIDCPLAQNESEDLLGGVQTEIKPLLCYRCDGLSLLGHFNEFVNKLDTYKCTRCSRNFRIMSKNVHKNSNTENEMKRIAVYKCNLCNLGFKDLELLEQHLDEKHADLNSYMCNTCQVNFNDVAELKKHNKLRHSS